MYFNENVLGCLFSINKYYDDTMPILKNFIRRLFRKYNASDGKRHDIDKKIRKYNEDLSNFYSGKI